MNIAARGKSLEEARALCYGAVEKVRFEKMHYRKDIGSSNASSAAKAAPAPR